MSANQERNNVSYRPLWWLAGTGLSLFVIGLCILAENEAFIAATSSWWSKVGFLLVALSMFIFFTIPGALLAVRLPWGVIWRLRVEQLRFVHPRLYGLALVWAGLVCSGSIGANLFVPLFTSIPYSVLAMELVALAPVFALMLFDRRR